VARPKSEDKRNAILSGATRVFADRGLSAAPTSEISRRAGIAEGTLFTYFKTKDELINALYRETKRELADAMMSGFSGKKSIRAKLEHIWNGYINWGRANPEQRKVLAQVEVNVWGARRTAAPFAELVE
jgi:AcrR family transcriptional regulator